MDKGAGSVAPPRHPLHSFKLQTSSEFCLFSNSAATDRICWAFSMQVERETISRLKMRSQIGTEGSAKGGGRASSGRGEGAARAAGRRRTGWTPRQTVPRHFPRFPRALNTENPGAEPTSGAGRRPRGAADSRPAQQPRQVRSQKAGPPRRPRSRWNPARPYNAGSAASPAHRGTRAGNAGGPWAREGCGTGARQLSGSKFARWVFPAQVPAARGRRSPWDRGTRAPGVRRAWGAPGPTTSREGAGLTRQLEWTAAGAASGWGSSRAGAPTAGPWRAARVRPVRAGEERVAAPRFPAERRRGRRPLTRSPSFCPRKDRGSGERPRDPDTGAGAGGCARARGLRSRRRNRPPE